MVKTLSNLIESSSSSILRISGLTSVKSDSVLVYYLAILTESLLGLLISLSVSFTSMANKLRTEYYLKCSLVSYLSRSKTSPAQTDKTKNPRKL